MSSGLWGLTNGQAAFHTVGAPTMGDDLGSDLRVLTRVQAASHTSSLNAAVQTRSSPKATQPSRPVSASEHAKI